MKRLTTEQFIQKAREVHVDRYDYSLVTYKNSYTKIKIVCKEHGIFEQTPKAHLTLNQGCPICFNHLRGKSRSATAKSEFTTKANLIHNNKYDYSLVEYTGNRYKVKIICPVHDVFEQTPNDHLRQRGCFHCAQEEKGWTRTKFKEKCIKNNNGLGILYVLECFNDNERFFKIGITSRSVKKRYATKTSMPYAYSVIKEIVGDPTYIYDLEIKLHQLNKENQYIPNISFDGSLTECFSVYKEIN